MKKTVNLLFLIAFVILLIGCGSDAANSEPPFAACNEGMVLDQFPCNEVGLYAHVTLEQLNGTRANDLWGWTDPETLKEYALVGLIDGVSIVEVTDPANPVFIGKLQEATASSIQGLAYPVAAHHDEEEAGGFKDVSAWRDVKVYGKYMIVVSEEQTHGMQIFDLERIRDVNSTPATFTHDALYDKIGNAHNVAVNEESGFAYITGTTTGEVCAEAGGLHIVNLNNPLQPEFAGCHLEPEAGGVIADGYIHDTQCVTYGGPDARFRGRELCFSSSERKFLISDVTDKSVPETIAVLGYSGNQYSHQGWLSEDHAFFFMNDELDERNNQHNTRTYVWDLEDLENPEMIGFYQHQTNSVDHNLYLHNNLAYQANYTSGLRILDVSGRSPETFRELGFFDTTPNNNDPVFAGLWSNYPWFSGNKIIVSDINSGLFILRFER